jgi:hypothetical protein
MFAAFPGLVSWRYNSVSAELLICNLPLIIGVFIPTLPELVL